MIIFMSKVLGESFRRWQGYMQFKSRGEAFVWFHRPLFILFGLLILLSAKLILLARYSLFACSAVNIFLWMCSFAFLYAGFIRKRNSYLCRFGKAAYKQAAMQFLLPYGAFWLSTTTMPLWVPGKRVFDLFPTAIPGVIFVVLGILLIRKTAFSLGIDRLIYVYSYYPQDAPLVKSKVFEFIRHPAYTAWLCLGLGFFFIRGSLSSLACFVLNFAAIIILIRHEERDIIGNFKEDYHAYQRNVPCIFSNKPLAFLRFLFSN